MEFEDTIDQQAIGLEDSRDQIEINNSYSTNNDAQEVSEDDQCELASRSNDSQTN